MMTLGCFAGYQGFDCSLIWVIMIMMFFLLAIFRKWIAQELADMEFSLIGGTILCEVAFIATLYIAHNFKLGFIVAMIVGIIAGFISGPWLGGEGGSQDGWF